MTSLPDRKSEVQVDESRSRRSPPVSRRPCWTWPNLLSLDAVAVGLFWQILLTVEFCGRRPSLAEASMIGLAIWLAYTADRLLDTTRIDRDRPHSLRHQFHLQHRHVISAVWCGALALETALVVTCAGESQLRWGLAAIAAVSGYLIVAQMRASCRKRWRIRVPKELLAGMLFAWGAGLLAWSETEQAHGLSLLVTTLMTGGLFAANCFVVGHWEHDLDRRQGFSSWSTRHPRASVGFPLTSLLQMLLTATLGYAGLIPPITTLCLIASHLSLLLMMAAVERVRRRHGESPYGSATTRAVSLTAPSPRQPFEWGTIADLALVAPPSLWLLGGILSG